MKGYQYKYQVALWWSDADEAFIAMAPEVPGCIMDGPTPEAALSNLNEVVEICLESFRERNLPLPRPAGRWLPLQDESDWKPLHDGEETHAAPQASATEAPSAARRGARPKSARRITTRSTHVTTENTV